MLQIKITKGTKRVNLRLKDSQTLHISVPIYYTKSDCEAVLERHRIWIESHTQLLRIKEEQRAKELESKNGKILYFGEWVENMGLNFDRELEDFIKERCVELATNMGVVYKSVRLSSAKSFFGICTYDNHLRFSRMLCFAPKECIEYVVIHELAHIQHKNHSKAFWALVGAFCQNYRELRTFLRQNAPLYKELLKRNLTPQ